MRRQREVVDAFLAASRDGRFDDLLALLDPDVVLRADDGRRQRLVRGAQAVASQASRNAALAPYAKPAVVNGVAGFVVIRGGAPVSVAAFTVVDGRIAAMDILADRERLARLDLSEFSSS